jgi:hypothetical protein
MEHSRISVLALQHCDITPFVGRQKIILRPEDVREAVRRGINMGSVEAITWRVAPHLSHLIPARESQYDDLYDGPTTDEEDEPIRIDDDVILEA